VAQSVESLTLGFGSGHDLMGHENQALSWALPSAERLLEDSLPLPLPSLMLSLSKIKK